MKKNAGAIGVMAALAMALLVACSQDAGGGAADGKAVLRLTDDPTGGAHAVNERLARMFTEHTGIGVEFVPAPSSATDRLALYLQFLGARSSDVDVYQIDVIWPGILAEHMVDLRPSFQDDLTGHFAPIVENNTVGDKLVAVPWFADAGILYCRTDLLEKYGFDGPPETWDDLERMARTIQEGERAAGNRDFWGYVWQGSAYEGLTCNVVEWLASSGAGSIVEPDGTVSIDSPEAAHAIARAAGWVNTISPPGVTTYKEEEARHVFHTGQAAFMRNWPYAYTLMQAEDSAVRDKFDVCVLPGEKGEHAAALGGWQLAVSAYSAHREEAIELVKFLSSPEAQKARALDASLLPSRTRLYDDPEIAAAIPFFPAMKEVFTNAAPRPSTVTGEDYNQVSTIVFQNVNRVLSGQTDAKTAVSKIGTELEKVMERSR